MKYIFKPGQIVGEIPVNEFHVCFYADVGGNKDSCVDEEFISPNNANIDNVLMQIPEVEESDLGITHTRVFAEMKDGSCYELVMRIAKSHNVVPVRKLLRLAKYHAIDIARSLRNGIYDRFNFWKPYPKEKLTKNGWYICSIRYGDEDNQAYVMDLFWDDNRKVWKDNRRQDVFSTYKVYNYKDQRLYTSDLCTRDDVVAFKRLPKIYKKEC